jgi:hypothetical protein
LFLLFALFVVYKGNFVYNVMISSKMINTNAQIVYMPLHKSIKQSGSSAKAQSTMISASGKKQAAAPSKPGSGPSTTIVQNKKNSKKKEIAPKATKQSSKKSITPKEKKVSEKIAPLIETKPVAPEPAKAVEQPATKVPEPVVPLQVEQASTTENVSSNVDASIENIVYVGQAEMEALQLQEFIQNEMAAHWSPPSGIRSDVQCVVKIIVSHDGKNNQIVFEQPSNILLFDSAAKRAATQLQPPQWSYGKEILITFKP